MSIQEFLLILGLVGLASLIIYTRHLLRIKEKFDLLGNLLTSGMIGLCLAKIADIVLIPDRVALFSMVTFLVTFIYYNIGKKPKNYPSEETPK